MIKKRILPCFLILSVTLLCVLVSRPTRILFFVAVAVASAFELESVLKQIDVHISKWLLSGYIAAQGVLCFFRVSVVWMIALFLLTAFLFLFWGVLQPEKGGRFASAGLFALVWPFAFYAIMIHAASCDQWLSVLAISVLGAWGCDSVAFLSGKAFGKRKLAPQVSPNKTWAGCIGGVIFGMSAGFLLWLIIRPFTDIPMIPCVVTMFVSTCFGQIGDLTASLIKRMAGVKDFSSFMGEHGGIMDKTDSLLFAVPAAYLCLYIAGLL